MCSGPKNRSVGLICSEPETCCVLEWICVPLFITVLILYKILNTGLYIYALKTLFF